MTSHTRCSIGGQIYRLLTYLAGKLVIRCFSASTATAKKFKVSCFSKLSLRVCGLVLDGQHWDERGAQVTSLTKRA